MDGCGAADAAAAAAAAGGSGAELHGFAQRRHEVRAGSAVHSWPDADADVGGERSLSASGSLSSSEILELVVKEPRSADAAVSGYAIEPGGCSTANSEHCRLGW